MTTQSAMTVPGVILDATVLSVVGSLGLYGIGRFISEDRLATLVDTKLGRFLGFKKDDIYKSTEWFQKKGKDVLIVLDDLGSHAKIYREMMSQENC